MRATVVMFPGINAEAEMIRTLREVAGAKVVIARHTDTELPAGTDLVAVPGGFSYGDYLRSGAIAKVAPVVAAIRRHAAHGGYVLGVCNGFQILTEAGLLPGALTRNVDLRFECRDVYVKVCAEGPFTPKKGDVWRLAIAHGEGRYHASAEVMKRLEGEGSIALRYVTAQGEVTVQANPNGSLDNVAGVYGGPKKNVLGLMPHPERSADRRTGGDDGRHIFEAVRALIGAGAPAAAAS